MGIIIVPLLTLCDKGIKQSQYPRETDDSELNFQPCKGKPNTHAWSTVESLPSMDARVNLEFEFKRIQQLGIKHQLKVQKKRSCM